MPDIRRAMTDAKLFGPELGGESFMAWRALLCGFYGLPLSEEEAAVWREVTQREELPTEEHDELWLAVGRRGGKSRAAALVATFIAAFMDHRPKLAPGEVATVMLIAGDRQQARTLMRYVRGYFQNPMLAQLVERQTENGLELSNRSAIEIGTASFRGVRGYTLAAAIGDEIAFWMSEGASPDEEIIAALRPALATLGGKLLAISSPYAKRGALWNAYRRHFGKPGRVLVAQAAARTMNPKLPQRVVDDAMELDPARASAEYLAQFRSDVDDFLSAEQVAGALRPEPLEQEPKTGTRYHAFVDPSGGGKDEFTLAIGHRDAPGFSVDLVRGRRGNPAAITAEYCRLIKEYGCSVVYGDRYSGEWSRTEFRRHGIEYRDAPGARSELYLDFLSAIRAGLLDLPPDEVMAKQFTTLERRATRGGRDIIDHAPNSSDDRANAVAGVISVMIAKRLEARSQTLLLGGLV